MDSTFKVPLTKILKVEKHPNADKLDICTVYGFQVATQKDKYKVGDTVVYVPIDSILPQDIEDVLFPKDAKIKLHHHRVRQIKIRSHYSQGMLIDSNIITIFNKIKVCSAFKLEDDLSEILGITKYEPPAKAQATPGTHKLRDKPLENPYFRKFNGIANIKWMPTFFKDEEIVIQEKIHGSHVRFGKAPLVTNTLLKKIKKLFGLAPKFEFVFGSNNVELTNRKSYTGYYGDNIYGKVLSQYDVINKIKDGEFVHGEIYGEGIQKNYHYGSEKGHKLIIFDIRVLQEDGTQKWLNPEEAEAYAKERGFDFVPVLYKGQFDLNEVMKHTSGPSVFYPKHKVREGCVVKSRYNYDNMQSKQVLKSINPDYLADASNTDFSLMEHVIFLATLVSLLYYLKEKFK